MQPENFTDYERSYRSMFTQINKYSISLGNSSIICRRCQTIFPRSDYSDHSRNCKRYTQKNRSQKIELSRPDTGTPVAVLDQAVQPDEFYNNLLASVLSFIKTGVCELLITTKYLKRGVVLTILGKKCLKFASSIPQIINENDYRTLVSDKFMSEVLKGINDVFNPTLVESRINSFSENRKTRIRKKLNSYLKSLEIEPLYVVDKNTHKFQRSKLPLMFRELSSFVLQLFSTQKRKYVHLGLDLLIFFHSLQRFPSSFEIVRCKVIEIMSIYQKDHLTYVNIESSTKTSKKVDMFLNKKLIELLIEFGWQDFAFGKRFYERFTEHFNFSMYSLRRGVVCQSRIFLGQTDVTVLTNHSSMANADYYLASLHKFNNKEFHEFLELQPDRKLKKIYEKYENFDRIFPKIIKPLQNPGERFAFKSLSFTAQQPLSFPPVHEELNKEMVDGPESKQETSSQESEAESQESQSGEPLTIQGFQFKLREGIFSGNIFFQQKRQAACRVCGRNSTTMMCIFCLKGYHNQCLPQFCSCMKQNISSAGIWAAGNLSSQKKLMKMPAEYFNKNSHLLASFRKLIHMRGFYFTTCATLLSPRAISSKNNEKAQQFVIEEYQRYEAGHYFPPLILGTSGDENPSGTGVGVFCLEDIKSNVLIGEYGGDIISEEEMIFIKRRDMSMLLAEVDGEKFYVGCVKHCSYVQLINSSKQNANCSIRLAIVNKKLKLLLYTNKQIKKNEELLYDYGDGFTFQFKTKLRKKLEIIRDGGIKPQPNQKSHFKQAKQGRQELEIEGDLAKEKLVQPIQNQQGFQFWQEGYNNYKTNSSKQELGKINKLRKCQVELSTNTCYAESLFMVYRYFLEYFVDTQSSLTAELRKKKMDPAKFVKMFYQFKEETAKSTSPSKSIPTTSSLQQEDIMEFYYFLEQKIIQNDSPFQQMAVSETKQCLKCLQLRTRFVSEKQWYVDVDNANDSVRLESSSEADIRCVSCLENTKHIIVKRLQSAPELLLLTFKRNGHSENMKLKYKVDLKGLKSHKGFQYELESVVVHIGQTANSGHYIVGFPKHGLVFDRNNFTKSSADYSSDVYMAIYKKKLGPTSKTRKYNIPSPSVGIYVDINGGLEQNVDKSYRIASIVKVITYLVCEKLRSELNIPLKQAFTIPRIKVYGLNCVLTENQQVSLQTLFELMLVCSSADVAASLVTIFGTLLQQQNSELSKYDPDDIFIDYMTNYCRVEIGMMDTVIRDGCGLKPNLSNIKDLKLLMQFIVIRPDLLSLLSQPSIIFKQQKLQNTNWLYKVCVGKTGTNKTNTFCFAGLFESKPLICLDFPTKKSMFNFIEDRIKSQGEKIKRKEV